MKATRLLFTLILGSVFAGNISAQSWKSSPTDDAYCKASKQETPSGSEATIHLKNSQYGDVRRDGYMKFDLSACDIAFPASSVKVYMYFNPGDLPYEYPGFYIYKLNGYTNADWSEATLVSANKPQGFNTGKFDSPDFIAYWDLILHIDDAEEGYYPIDITTYANAQKAGGSNEINFIIRGDAAAGAGGEIHIHSKEAEDENVRPYIEVVAGGTGIGSASGNDIMVNAENGYISLENAKESTLIEVYAANGVCIAKEAYDAPVYVGEVGGVYILKIQNGDVIVNKKVVL